MKSFHRSYLPLSRFSFSCIAFTIVKAGTVSGRVYCFVYIFINAEIMCSVRRLLEFQGYLVAAVDYLDLVYTKTVESRVFSRALIGCSISEYPALFTDSPPVPPSERRQTRVSYEQNGLPVCCRNKQRNFTNNQTSCSRNRRRR